MPNPLSRFPNAGKLKLDFSSGPCFEHNVELSILAMESIASWSAVDAQLLKVYIAILRPGVFSTDHASIGYLALGQKNAKMAMMRKVAIEFLTESQWKVLEALLRIASSCESKRNKLAHCCWGTCSGLPNAYVLAEPKEMAYIARGLPDKSKYFVYTKSDFEGIVRDNNQLNSYLEKLFVIIRFENKSERGDQLLFELCEERPIRDMIRNQAWLAQFLQARHEEQIRKNRPSLFERLFQRRVPDS